MLYIEEPKLINNLRDKDMDYFIFNKETNITLLTKKMKNLIYKKLEKDAQNYKDIMFFEYNININDECNNEIKNKLTDKFNSLYSGITDKLSSFNPVIKSKRYNSKEEKDEGSNYYFSNCTFNVFYKDFIYTINKNEYDDLVNSFLSNLIDIGDSISEKFFVSKIETSDYLISDKITDDYEFYFIIMRLFSNKLRKEMEEFISDNYAVLRC